MSRDEWRWLAKQASRRHGVFTRDMARKAGIDAQQLRRAVAAGRVARQLSDVFTMAGAPATWKQRLLVLSDAGGIVSHRSAAALHRLDGFVPGRLEVSFERHRHRRLGDEIIVHRWTGNEAADITTVEEIRVTSVARTLVQLGAVAPCDRVEQALDSALRDGYPPRWIEETLVRLWRPGPTGAGVLAEIIRDPARAGALPDSWFERLVQRLLDVPGLPPAVLQHEVRLPGGTRRIDLAWPDVKLGVEAHSRLHHWGPRVTVSDDVRDLELAAHGWQLLYLTWGVVQEPGDAVDLVIGAYRRRVARTGS